MKINSFASLSAGASFTRFQTLRLQKIFPESLANQLISYGSCQFPTLGFVVERFKAIKAFIPETFYKIKGNTNFKKFLKCNPPGLAPSLTCFCLWQCCTRWRKTRWSSTGNETGSLTTPAAWCSTRSAWRYDFLKTPSTPA